MSEAAQETPPETVSKRMRTALKLILALLVFLLILIAALLAFVYSGIYNIAATRPDTGFEDWLFGTTMVHSVQARADEIIVPDLNDPKKVQTGYWYYKEMCEICHGAPGVPPTALSQGLMPPAPDLQQAASQWNNAELFWIVKHGIRMTGMPAWGPTHSNDQIWQIVAFLDAFPSISAKEYEAMGQRPDGKPPAHKHDHTHDHDTDHAHEHEPQGIRSAEHVVASSTL